MKVIKTDNFIKIAGSWDDQPGFIDRDVDPGGLGKSPSNPSKKDIIDGFDEKKRKKRKRKTKRIYQLGLDVPLSPREEKADLINL